MKKKNKLVYGVGINDLDESVGIGTEDRAIYDRWQLILERCYSTKHQTIHPTYVGCTICDDWKYLSKFRLWFNANYREGFHIDKDILVKGNKLYSPETCCFVPPYINNLALGERSDKGDLPTGICKQTITKKSGKQYTYYHAKCKNGSGVTLEETFKTVEDAINWYSITKKKIILDQVQRALSEGAIDQRIANALLGRDFT